MKEATGNTPARKVGKLAALAMTPLMAALVATSAQAVTFKATDNTSIGIGGLIFAQSVWAKPDGGDATFGMNQATTRLNFDIRTQTQYGQVRVFMEEELSGAATGRRHRALFWNDYVVGWTWSSFADQIGGGEILAPVPLASGSSWMSRNLMMGRNFKLSDTSSIAVSIEDRQLQGANGSALPDLTANYRGKLGSLSLHLGAQFYQLDKFDGSGDSEGKARFILGASLAASDALTLKASFITDEDNYDGAAVSVQYKLTDQWRTNLVVEQILHNEDAAPGRGAATTNVRRPADRPKGLTGAVNEDHQKIFLNAIYRTQVGVEVGGEVEVYNGDSKTDTLLTLQARYGF